MYSKVVSSGAMRPARAPPSMDMLQMVIRSSIDRPRMASPPYSKTWPVPPPTPMREMRLRMMSLAVTPGRRAPLTFTANDLGGRCSSVCVASTISTSLVPMPNASAPNAPWVAVWESPHTMVMPGCVRPSSGPMTCTMPCLSEPRLYSGTPNSAQLRSSCWTWKAACWSRMGSPMAVVGVEWSAVATVRSGCRTLRPRVRRPSNACGLVTSCTRWRSMPTMVGAPGSSWTMWSSQILRTSVRGAGVV